MKLFYVPRTRSTRPRWVLEEMGVSHTLHRLDASKRETHTPEHLARHPLGHVPVMQFDDTHVFESSAICLQLTDLFPDKGLNFAPGTIERGLVYQWIFYGQTELESLGVQYFRFSAEKKLETPEAAEVKQKLNAVLVPLEKHLTGRTFLVSEKFTVADIIVGAMLTLINRTGLLAEHPSLLAYWQRLSARPAFQRAYAD